MKRDSGDGAFPCNSTPAQCSAVRREVTAAPTPDCSNYSVRGQSWSAVPRLGEDPENAKAAASVHRGENCLLKKCNNTGVHLKNASVPDNAHAHTHTMHASPPLSLTNDISDATAFKLLLTDTFYITYYIYTYIYITVWKGSIYATSKRL